MSEYTPKLSPRLQALRRECILAERAGDDDALYEALQKFQDAAREEAALKAEVLV